MTDFDWNLIPANMDYYRKSEVDELIDRAKKERQTLLDRLNEIEKMTVMKYPCYSACDNCTGRMGKIDRKTCIGHNVLNMLRGVEGLLREETDLDV